MPLVILSSKKNHPDVSLRLKPHSKPSNQYAPTLSANNPLYKQSLFRSGPSVATRDYVYDLLTGVSMRIETLRVSVTRIKRSEEFYTPLGGGGKQKFYSFNIGIEF